MPNLIEGYRLTRFALPRDRVIGDSQVRFDKMYLAALELTSTLGHTGTGFFSNCQPLPNLTELNRIFEAEIKAGFIGESPHALTTRIYRPRGGNIHELPYNIAEAIDQAAWDLKAQELGMPLYQLLGGHSNRVRAYASGLDFHYKRRRLHQLLRLTVYVAGKNFKCWPYKLSRR